MDSVQTWVDSLMMSNHGLAITSAVKYLPILFEFAEFVAKKPDEMIADARASLRSPESEYKYPRKLRDWFKDLNSKGFEWNVSVKKLRIIKSFFRRNEIKLDYEVPKRVSSPYPFAPEKALLREAFLSLERGSPWRSWILLQSQSGLSEVDILNLRADLENSDKYAGPVFESIKSQVKKGSKFVHIVIPRQKTSKITITFIGIEAISLLEFYKNGQLFPWKQPAHNSSSTITRGFEKFQEILNERRFTSHTLRKYFQTTLETEHVNSNWIKLMMGHSRGAVEGAYSVPPIPKMQEEYERVYPALRLFDEKYLGRLGTLSRASL